MQESVVARKELREKQKGTDERSILDLLATLQHPNIVPFLGSYTQHGVGNLLFPYVPIDLAELLRTERAIDAYDIYLGMHGIADALGQIHNFSFLDGKVEFCRIGYHHDLRPSNILVQGKAFLIADFGLSRLKQDDRDSKSRLKGGHDDYLGPEAFNPIDWTSGTVGRALDIWSLGCVLAEIATFIERRSVEEFRNRREATYGSDITQTDSAFHLEGKVRPAVTAWLVELTRQPSDQQVPGLVHLINKMLDPNPYRRMKIAAVTESLALIATHSQVQTIDQRFQAVSRLKGPQIDQFAAQLFLEQKRFESWERVFHGLHKDEQLGDLTRLFAGFSHLLDVLASVRLRHTDANENRQGSNHIMREVWAANDSLCTYLSSEGCQKMQDRWTRTICELKDTNMLAAIRSIAALNRYRVVGASVAMRYMSQLMTASISLGKRSRYIDPGCIEIDERWPTDFDNAQHLHLIKDQTRTMGHMYGESGSSSKRVMIEWREYDNRWQGDHGAQLFATMDALVNLLDPSVTPREGAVSERIVSCCGYFHEPRNYRFGFIYPIHTVTTLNDANLFSLNNIMRMTDPYIPELEHTLRPNLGAIFTVAASLSSCLHALHAAGWVHKSLSSHHLLVFAPSPSLVHEHVASVVLAGFHDSRPEASGYTLGPRDEYVHYRHPLYTGEVPFRKSFDYFGLGVVLLELGLWRPVSVLRSDHPEIASDEEFRSKLMLSYVPQLGERMGAVYRDAVAFCLDAERLLENVTGTAGNSPDGDGQELFRSRVMEPLSRCFA
ncbi:MAG: hypothetical protein Q9201_003459 [Fulgogasparrea decipioides]